MQDFILRLPKEGLGFRVNGLWHIRRTPLLFARRRLLAIGPPNGRFTTDNWASFWPVRETIVKGCNPTRQAEVPRDEFLVGRDLFC